MTLKAVQCSSCGDKLYSRCPQDIQECHCTRTSLSGNPENPTVKINGVKLLVPTIINIELKGVDPDVLYWDWELRADNFGVISEFEEKEKAHVLDKYLIEL